MSGCWTLVLIGVVCWLISVVVVMAFFRGAGRR